MFAANSGFYEIVSVLAPRTNYNLSSECGDTALS